MKKYLLFVLMCTSLINTNVFAGIYGADLIAAQKWGDKQCRSGDYGPPGTIIHNRLDSGSFFVCAETDGEIYAILEYCDTTIFGLDGFNFPGMYNKNTGNCERDHFLIEIDIKINNGDYAGRCDAASRICDCRDNPGYEKATSGTCKCSDYGTHMDYSTCTAGPPCPQIKDINGIDRAAYDPNIQKCYAPAGYTFRDVRGNYEFTTGCVYSN